MGASIFYKVIVEDNVMRLMQMVSDLFLNGGNLAGR